MKKFFLILAVAVMSTVAASAQPRAIGLRLGYGGEISYEHSLGGNFLEANLTALGFSTLGVAATYNFMIAQPDWTVGEWGFYAGPGASVMFAKDVAAVGVGGQVGLEYTFANAPIQLSIDWRPTVGPEFADGTTRFFFNPYAGGLSIRYRF